MMLNFQVTDTPVFFQAASLYYPEWFTSLGDLPDESNVNLAGRFISMTENDAIVEFG